MSSILKTTTLGITSILLLLAAAPLAQAVIPPAPYPLNYALTQDAWVWDDVSGTGTPLAGCDDCLRGPVSIGFDFSFYSTSFSQLYVSSNGFVSFAPGSDGCCGGPAMPSNLDNIIAGYWDDLNPGAGGSMRYQAFNDAGNERFVVQYTNVPFFYNHGANTFQIVLFKSGDIEVRIQNGGSDGGFHTTGIEKSDTQYVQAYNGAAGFTNMNFHFEAPLVNVPVPSSPPATLTGRDGPLFMATPADHVHQSAGVVAVDHDRDASPAGGSSRSSTTVSKPGESVFVGSEFYDGGPSYKWGFIYTFAPTGNFLAAGYYPCAGGVGVFAYNNGFIACQATPVFP